MPNTRKKIVLNEILFWKQNKLLPEQYCDFLMTLYSEGDELAEEIHYKKSVKEQEKKFKFLKILLVIMVAFGLFASLFMASNTWVTPIIILSAIVAMFFIIASFVYVRKKVSFTPILQVSAALLIFGLSVKCATEYFPENQVILIALLISNCLLWLLTGFKYKLVYFTLSGVIGLVVIICYQFIF